MTDARKLLEEELGREPTDEEVQAKLEELRQSSATVPGDEEGRFEFDIIGVQVGMRRYPLKDGIKPVTISIGGFPVQAYACIMVDPAAEADAPPNMMEVLIPVDQVTMFIIEQKEDELEAAAKREAEAEQEEDNRSSMAHDAAPDPA